MLIGWSAVTNGLTWAPVVLFGVIFVWTPPHFWALAIKYRDDYAAADVPMLPVVASLRSTNRHIVGYTIVLWASTLVFAPVADMGLVYTRRGGRPRRGVPVDRRRLGPLAVHRQGHAPLRILDHLPRRPLRRDGRRSVDPVGLLIAPAKCPHNSPLATGA